jgi:hypothetical protein
MLSNEHAKVGAMVSIFAVSLFGPYIKPILSIFINDHHTAVSFPSIANRIQVLRVPHIIFFVGKHFGTGISFLFSPGSSSSPARCHSLHSLHASPPRRLQIPPASHRQPRPPHGLIGVRTLPLLPTPVTLTHLPQTSIPTLHLPHRVYVLRWPAAPSTTNNYHPSRKKIYPPHT